MKFNEKLIMLRKKEGLSQEELGYKLNVTRQTVSKWELGQTTPEMDKLSEMSRIFNVSVDQLINDSETINNVNNKIEDQPIYEKNNKKTSPIMFFVFTIFIIIIIMFVAIGLCIFMKESKLKEDVFSSASSILDGISDIIKGQKDNIANDETKELEKDVFSSTNSIINGITNGQEDNTANDEIKDEITAKFFNAMLELYGGTTKKSIVVEVLDKVITNNKTNERKIMVKYNKTETQEEKAIREIKQKINKEDSFQDFEIIYEYDEDGYIYKVEIEKL